MAPGERRTLTISGLILGASLLAFLWNLGGKSLWLDEAWSVDFAGQSLSQLWNNGWETNPRLYYLLLGRWIHLFGISEVALRSFSVIFGVVAVAFTGWVGGMLGGRRLAWLSMAFIGLSPVTVTWAQTARAYTLFLAAVLASYAFLLAWERKGGRGNALGWVIASLVMIQAHNYWPFTMLAQQVYMARHLFRDSRRRLLSWAGMSLAVFVVSVPWLVKLARISGSVITRGFWVQRPDLGTLLEVIHGYLSWVGFPVALAWGYLGLAALGLPWRWFFSRAVRRRSPGEPAETVLLLTWLLCPLLIPFVMSQFITPIFLDRYTIAALPAFVLLVAGGINRLPWKALRGAVTALLLVLLVLSLGRYYPHQGEDWRSLASDVGKRAGPGDVILVVDPWNRIPFDYYYRGRAPVHAFAKKRRELPRASFREAIRKTVARRGDVWLITRYGFPEKGGVDTMIQRRYRQGRIEKRVYRGNLRLLRFTFSPGGRNGRGVSAWVDPRPHLA